MIQAVIFDRDHTLVYPDPARIADIHADLDTIVPGCIRHIEEQWVRWPGPWPAHEDDEPAFWHNFWTPLAARFNWSPAVRAQIGAIGPRYATCFRAFPDALPAIQAIRTRGLRIGVLTNFGLPSVAQTLEAAGLPAHLFDCLVSAGAYGTPKPHPHAYQIITTQLDLAYEQCLFVDDLVENVAGAASAGMRAIRLDRSKSSEMPETIATLLEIPGLLT